jgi:hypothetical protein
MHIIYFYKKYRLLENMEAPYIKKKKLKLIINLNIIIKNVGY